MENNDTYIREARRTYIGRDGQTLPVGQSEQFVVIEDRVEVLHPLRVNVSIKDDPLAFPYLPSNIVDDPARLCYFS